MTWQPRTGIIVRMWLPDFRFALRLLAKNPLFTGGVIGLLALGIAANTVIFSVVDALLLRPLPVRAPERLVRPVTIRPPLAAYSEFTYDEYETWKKHIAGFEDIFAWSEHDMFVGAGETVERSRVHFVTDNFFSALGVTPLVGRLLTRDDDRPSTTATAPAVLSYPYWRQRFAGDAGVVGRSITVDGHKLTIVGVSARGFNGLTVETTPDVRVPVGWLRTLRPNLYENTIFCEVGAHLRAGASLAAARAQAESLWRHGWLKNNPTDPGVPGRFDLESAARGVSRLRTRFAGVLWLLMGGVGLLALMVCANVAGPLGSELPVLQACFFLGA